MLIGQVWRICVTLKEKVSVWGCRARLGRCHKELPTLGGKKKGKKKERTFRPESLRAHKSLQLTVHDSGKWHEPRNGRHRQCQTLCSVSALFLTKQYPANPTLKSIFHSNRNHLLKQRVFISLRMSCWLPGSAPLLPTAPSADGYKTRRIYFASFGMWHQD